MRTYGNIKIPNGGSVSQSLELSGTCITGVIMPAAWTTAALTIEVSADASTWIGLVYNSDGTQCNSVAAPAVSSAYAFDLAGMIPYQFIRIRSGTTASPVNQADERTLVVCLREVA